MADNGWEEYKKLVLSELERFNKNQDKFDKKLDKVIIDIATLKVKASIWGALGGMVPILIAIIVWIIRSFI